MQQEAGWGGLHIFIYLRGLVCSIQRTAGRPAHRSTSCPVLPCTYPPPPLPRSAPPKNKQHTPHRKHGHNEIDEPMFTQPLMYKKIRQHKNAHQQYVERLLTEGDISKQQVGGYRWAAGRVCRAA